MKTITKYQICRSGLFDHLEVKVNAYISQGWVPLGQPFIFGSNCCQAMVYEYEEDEEEPK